MPLRRDVWQSLLFSQFRIEANRGHLNDKVFVIDQEIHFIL